MVNSPHASIVNLLKAEKQRRGLPSSTLVFVGMHKVAQFWWCGMYAVLKSRANEHEFFAAYLDDRVRYAQTLGKIKKVPRATKELLTVGESLTLNDIERIHAASIKERSLTKRTGEGEYATFRWFFQWKGFVLLGVPDGITPTFVYEAKEAKNRFFATTVSRPVATTQADLYGVFFGRTQTRVEITIRDEGVTERIDGPVDRIRAETTLKKFESVAAGELPRPPKAYKCANCEYRQMCPICQV